MTSVIRGLVQGWAAPPRRWSGIFLVLLLASCQLDFDRDCNNEPRPPRCQAAAQTSGGAGGAPHAPGAGGEAAQQSGPGGAPVSAVSSSSGPGGAAGHGAGGAGGCASSAECSGKKDICVTAPPEDKRDCKPAALNVCVECTRDAHCGTQRCDDCVCKSRLGANVKGCDEPTDCQSGACNGPTATCL